MPAKNTAAIAATQAHTATGAPARRYQPVQRGLPVIAPDGSIHRNAFAAARALGVGPHMAYEGLKRADGGWRYATEAETARFLFGR